MATQVKSYTGTVSAVVAFLNTQGLTLAEVIVLNEGTTNAIVVMYEEEEGN